MARKTMHFVDTYNRGARGKLVVHEHREFKTPEQAIQRAAYIADRVAGALAYSIDVDGEFDDVGEPRVLARHGDTPEE